MNLSQTNDLIFKSIENFINICENSTSNFSRHRDKLNSLLNELNSIDFKYKQSLDVHKFSDDLVAVLLKIPLDEDTIIVKTSCFIVQMINKNPASISSKHFADSLTFLIEFIKKHKFVGICDALRLMQTLIRNQDKNETVSIADASPELHESIKLLIGLIDDPNGMKKTMSCHYDGYSTMEIVSSATFCLETILSHFDKLPLIALCDDVIASITTILIRLIYSIRLDELTVENYCVLMRSALSSCRYIGFANKIWCTEQIGDILGVCVSNMLFGLPDHQYQTPSRVQSSQQEIQDNRHSAVVKKGGKTVKGRKPRQTPQYKSRKDNNNRTKDTVNLKSEDAEHCYAHSILFENSSEKCCVTQFTTSESDASDSESNRTTTNNREKEAKLRLAALSLISVIAKNVEKKIVFGYWHCLFPTEELTPSTVALLNCVLRDSNQRCRITALQATSLILYGTKSFLVQAETTENPPASFMPFSIALGNRIRVMYLTLTQALGGESSLPVLTQILKCLAVLVQSTSFQRMQKPPGLIRKFITYIRRLVYHKDPTIKVAALIVMEFLIARSEMVTSEISECVGLHKLEIEDNHRIHEFGEDEIINAEENSPDSDCDENDQHLVSETNEKSEESTGPVLKISWLLQIALENLGVTVCSYIRPNQSALSVQVRHQSLQIILTMAPHFIWLKSHLLLISQALENSLQDDVASIRQRAARCMDIIAHSISTYLMAQNSNKLSEFDDDIEVALLFWTKMLQSIMEQLQDSEQIAGTKSIFCDVFSNIGVHVYERLPRDKQIVIISLLSGLSLGDDESIVRASAVRALAIFVLFPSMREDICFIENTIEATIRIIQDENLPVRIKASWALANITDALVTNINDLNIERISDDLLLRLFEIITPTCNDNDKVRTNAARILGNLLRLLKLEQTTNSKWQTKCVDAIKCLVEQAKLTGGNSNMKVKWNACYAIGNFMKNSVIFDLDTKLYNWQESVYQTLSDITVKCANFKVRINGAAALAIPSKRIYYNKYYLNVWSGCLTALYQANCLTDFNEYNHRDNLLDQLCITISHLLSLATLDDLSEIENILLQHMDSTKQNWIRVINRMVPEKAASLLAANVYLKNIYSTGNVSSKQKHALHTLLTCFVSITEYDE